jgi:RNA polymerase sigma factor (sigma-70 family)
MKPVIAADFGRLYPSSRRPTAACQRWSRQTPPVKLTPPAVLNARDARWFAEELQPHEPALRAWLHSRYPGCKEVDDVINESYLTILQRQSSGPIVHTKAYLFASARNAALKVFRKRRIYSDTPVNELPDSRLVDTTADVVKIVQARQDSTFVAWAISRLPTRCREIVRLRAVHGLSYEAIARRLGLSEATVRVQICRGIKKCAGFLRESGMAD